MHASLLQGLLTLALLKDVINPSRLTTEGGVQETGTGVGSTTAMLLAVGLTAAAAFILVLPSLIRRWRQDKEPIPRPARRISRRSAPLGDATAPDPDAQDAFVPVNFHHVPSAGLVSMKMRARKKFPFSVALRPEDVDPAIRARLLQRKLAAHEEKIRSQQARMAWLEERLQSLNEELRTLRAVLHEQGARQDEHEHWRPPLNRLDD